MRSRDALRSRLRFAWHALAIMVAVCLLLVSQDRLRATNHLIHMEEIMAGANGNSKIQFIIVEQEFGGQNAWGPTNGLQSAAMLVFFDATGRETGKFKFPANPPTNGSLKTLIATQEFANLPGAPAPDVIIPPLLHPISGKVCFKGNPLNPFSFPRNECVSYGSFTGDTETNSGNLSTTPAGAPAAALSIVNTLSLRRTAHTDRNVDFSTTAVPTPRNIANATFTIPVASQVVQGQNLFSQEAFLGNGRTCASCHVGKTFGLPPSDITTRFGTLSTTFDPQFIGETAPSAFDPGFDFNLNVLVLTAPVASNTPCTGELRGIITTPNGGRAKVLTRHEQNPAVSTSRYLVYGGMNPTLSGTVSDSNSCSATVSSMTAGSVGAIVGSGVSGLEDPFRMRRSGSADFPQGRALILENIDGFPPTAHVFRKSPHLLNLSRTAPFGLGGNVPNLQIFSGDAVMQHFPRTLTRTSTGTAPDFRIPSTDERVAMEAFMLAQEFPPGSNPDKFNLDLFALTTAQQNGRTAFFGATAKCSQCHGGTVLAETTVNILGKGVGVNAAFNTGVVNQLINSVAVDNLPCEPAAGFGACGSREFSTPQLFNSRNLAPFFHDASASTLLQAVEFYTSPAFNNSPAGGAIGGIAMSAGMMADIVAFLESLAIPSISPNSTTTLSGAVGAAVSPAPSVLVTNSDGTPAVGVTVTFAITAGSGSLSGATPTTNGSGIATVGSWTLAAGANTLTATASTGGATVFEGNPVSFGATGVLPVATDSFASRPTLTGVNVTATGSNVGFTLEAGETASMDGIGSSGSTTGWYTWTAPCSFSVTQPNPFIDTIGSNFDTVLGVFTGSTVAALTLFAGDDDAGGSATSRVPSTFPGPSTLNVVAGTVFQIRVRGFAGTTSGNIVLHITTPCVSNTSPTITTISDQTNIEDTATGAIAFTVGDTETAVGSLTPSGTSSNTTLLPNANANITFGGSGANRTVTLTPAANQSGTTNVTVTVTDAGSLTASRTFQLIVFPIPDTPSVTNATTNEDTQTASGLVISRNAADGAEVTHFKITSITGGTLFQNDGTTAIVNNAFITFAQGNAGLKFTPAANAIATGHFTIQAADIDQEVGGGTVTADITVNPVADTFVVNSTLDAVDATPGNGVCATAGAVCTLRAAVQEANALLGADIITLPAGTYTLAIAGAGEGLAATGDLDINESLTINGGGAATTIIDANSIDRVLHFTGVGGVFVVNGVTVRNGNPGATSGGCIIVNSGNLQLTASAVTGCTGLQAGGGIQIISSSTATINRTTISGNVAQQGGGINSQGTVTIANSTISGNVATTGSGGAIFTGVTDGSVMTLVNVTIAASSSATSGAVRVVAPGVLQVRNTIVANSAGVAPANCSGTLSNLGNNLEFPETACGFTAANPLLGPLANNGGTTLTHAPGLGSPAVDAGDDATCAAAPVSGVDQRGSTRSAGAHCDIGAFEGALNNLPTISPISNRGIRQDTSTGALAFTIGDIETAAGSLTVSRASSNQTVVPTANVVLGGSGASRTATVTPAAGQSGTATITITVNDGTGETNMAFVLVVIGFTDNVLTPGVTLVKRVHVIELRALIDQLRAELEMEAFVWTGSTITAETTPVLAQHIQDLRTALTQAYAQAGETPPTFTEPTLTGGVSIKVVHIEEIRAALIALIALL